MWSERKIETKSDDRRVKKAIEDTVIDWRQIKV